MKTSRPWILAALVAAGCGAGEAGTGDVSIDISGQRFVRTGWPTMDEGERVEFHDGWKVTFDHVVVSIEAFRLAEDGEKRVAEDPAGFLVDVRQGDAALWMLADVPAGRWSDVGYRFAVPDDDYAVVGELESDLAETMRQEGYSLWIEGDGEKDGRTVHYAFGIPAEVTTLRCLNGRDETDGMVVGEGRVSEVEVTLHMDHLFWDDHDAEEPRLLFGPLAYAAGDDDAVTLDELASQRLTDLRDEDGEALVDEDGVPIVYVPREELPDNDLREYMIDTALTLGHFNGEGHCRYEVQHTD